MPNTITMKALLETGVHFGHRTRKWNPKMRRYIFTERNGVHILDLHQTLKALRETYDLVRDTVAEGGTLLFVGTKRQAQETIAREAERCGMPYVNQRWLGGTLTNWRTIRQRIEHLKSLEGRRDRGEFDLLTKKEALDLEREIERLKERLGGIREMTSLPSLIFLVDVQREYTAVHEANILDIPIIAMVDTNGNPDVVDYVIPSNDDAIRAIKLIAGVMADAVLEGRALRKDEKEFELEAAETYDERYAYPEPSDQESEIADEEFLGEATLAKLRSGSLRFEGDEFEAQVESEEETEFDLGEEPEAELQIDELDDSEGLGMPDGEESAE